MPVVRLLMMTVAGGVQTPYHKLVTVDDPMRLIAFVRARMLAEYVKKLSHIPVLPPELQDEVNEEVLRSLKVKIYETGLNEYPETDAEVEALYKRFESV